MNKVLSICIPTYNRPHYLETCLDNLIKQFEDGYVRDNAEVVLSDNSDNDKTFRLYIDKYSKYDYIKYYTNRENIGGDKNIIRVVERAGGKYCWYMGDDDIICLDGLKFVTKLLKENDLEVVTVNSTALNDLNIEKNNDIKEKDIKYFDKFGEFSKYGNCAGIFSILIFNREGWLKNLDRDNFVEGWIYFEVVLKMLPGSKRGFAFIDYPIVLTRDDCRWAEGGAELTTTFVGWKHLVEKLISFGFDKNQIDMELIKFPKRLIVMLLRAKGHGLKISKENFKILYREFKHAPFYLMINILVFFIPNPVVIFVRDLNKKTFKIKL